MSVVDSSIASRSRLRSASSRRYEQPVTRLNLGERSFAFAGPAAWNSIPTSLHEITNHKAFIRKLNTVHFLNEHTVHNNRILTFSFLCYAPLVTLRCKRRTTNDMYKLNYEL